MIAIIKQDKIDGELLDTTIEVNFTITVAGEELKLFEQQLNEFIDRYRI